MDGLPVTIRLLDPPLHEFLPPLADVEDRLRAGADRGLAPRSPRSNTNWPGSARCRRSTRCSAPAASASGSCFPSIYEMQVEAIFARPRRLAGGGRRGPRRDHGAAGRLPARARDPARADRARSPSGTGWSAARDYAIGTMIEMPRACLRADEIAERGRLLLVRDQRPDPDRARLLARRHRGPHPRPLHRDQASSTARRSRPSTRPASASWCGWAPGSRAASTRSSSSASAASTAATPTRSSSSTTPGSTTSPARRTGSRSPASPPPRRRLRARGRVRASTHREERGGLDGNRGENDRPRGTSSTRCSRSRSSSRRPSSASRRCGRTRRSTRRPRPTRWPGGLAQAKELLDWETEPTEGLDDSNPPFYKWFADGRLNASAQCLDRHVAAGSGERVAYHWRGEEGETPRRHLRRAAPRLQRFANALKDLGVREGRRGRDLPADDPRGRRRDARLRPDRRAPQRRLRRLLRRVGRASGWSSPRPRRWSPSTAPAARARPRRSSRAGRRAPRRPRDPGDDRRRPRTPASSAR